MSKGKQTKDQSQDQTKDQVEQPQPFFSAGPKFNRPQNPPENSIYYSDDTDEKERFIKGEWVLIGNSSGNLPPKPIEAQSEG